MDPVPTPEMAREHQAYIERLDDEVGELAAHIEAASYRLLTLIREFDDACGWSSGGFRSCAHWLSWRTNLSLGAARERVRVARALPRFPLLSEAMRTARISYSKARAITRFATAKTEENLVEIAQHVTVSHVEDLGRKWRRVERAAEAEQDERRRRNRRLSYYFDDDGMLVLRARLEPESGVALLRAIDAAKDRLYQEAREAKKLAKKNEEFEKKEGKHVPAGTFPPLEEPSDNRPDTTLATEVRIETPMDEPSTEQKRADALAVVAESALSGGLDPRTRGDRYQVVVHIDANVLAHPDCRDDSEQPGQSYLKDGPNISPETARRLACDTSRSFITSSENGPNGTHTIDVGRKTRAISPALRRALTHRDRTCRFPGCNSTLCDAHHIEHWAEGGRTDMDNLVLLCRRHHRAVHEGGFRVELADATGEIGDRVHFYRPTGHLLPESVALPPYESDPVQSFRDWHAEEQLDITARSTPLWGGGVPEWPWVIENLWLAREEEREEEAGEREQSAYGTTSVALQPAY